MIDSLFVGFFIAVSLFLGHQIGIYLSLRRNLKEKE
jgi:hypothetical protein